MGRHVLVTGGAGFIGSHLADAYLERGWRVSVIDDLSTGSRKNLDPRVDFHEVDLRAGEATALVAELKPDVISHHAAQMDLRKSVVDPTFDADVNIIGSVRLLQAAKGAGVKRFIFASSGGAIYGEPESVPQGESHPARPVSPYGCAKLSVEHYLHFYSEVHGMECAALRYANVYGPRQNAHGEAGVVAIFCGRLLDGEEVTINGSGEQTRDFVYVGDVVAANMAVSERSELCGAFNVGTGVETSVNELHAKMAAVAGSSRAPKHAPAKPGEQLRSVIDASRLWNAAGLPAMKTLDGGLRETIDWFRAEGRR